MSDMTYALLGTVSVVLLAIAIAVGARRLLGLSVGTLRMMLACMVGFGAAVVVGNLISTPINRGVLATVMIGISVLVTMGFLVLAEAVVPNRSRPVEWARRIRRRAVRVRRYLQIVGILMRHGLTPFLRGRHRLAPGSSGSHRLAVSVRMALEDGGVTFVKFGQLLSTRHDVLPGTFTEELSKLQCQVPALPWEDIRQVLVEELGSLVDDAFIEFDPVALAAGSIAQVHRARLRDGTEVVVKIQRPGIRPVVERDLDILDRLAATLEARTEWAGAIGATALAEGFALALREEMDFRVEARSMIGIRAGLASSGSSVRVPVPDDQLCTQRVLVMELLPGIPLGSARTEIVTRGLDPDKLANILLDAILRQVMDHGIFHCDPHPGNVLLLDDGDLALVDFGVVGRVDSRIRTALQSLLIAVKRDDRAALCDALLEIVVRKDDIDEMALERALGEFMARHLTPGSNPSMEMFNGLFQLVARHHLTVPPQVAAVFRTFTTLQGTLAQLTPGYDLVAESREFAAARYTEKLRPSTVREAVGNDLLEIVPLLRRLPRRVDRITAALEQGRLGVTVRLSAHEKDRKQVVGLVHLGLITILGAATGIMAVMLLGTSGGPQITPTLSLFQVFGYNLLVISMVLGLRVLVRVFRGENFRGDN
jgi:ubiquinone biosynthesis protein